MGTSAVDCAWAMQQYWNFCQQIKLSDSFNSCFSFDNFIFLSYSGGNNFPHLSLSLSFLSYLPLSFSRGTLNLISPQERERKKKESQSWERKPPQITLSLSPSLFFISTTTSYTRTHTHTDTHTYTHTHFLALSLFCTHLFSLSLSLSLSF